MTDPGSPVRPDGPPSGPPLTTPTGPADGSAPATTGRKKWVSAAGGALVAGVAGLGALTGWFGIGAPEVGDCVELTGETSFEVVDCAAPEAQYRIVGVEEGKQTFPDFEADPDSCSAFPAWEVALWSGEVTQEGTVYCAESV